MAAGHFYIFSIERAASLTPATLNPAPATLIDLGEDPMNGDYNPNAGTKGRGSRIPTLGGAVDQDFGSSVKDGKISLSVTNSQISAATIAALETAFNAVSTQYYFTDGLSCWKVKFAKPGGFVSQQNLLFAANGHDVFSYSLALNIDSKDI